MELAIKLKNTKSLSFDQLRKSKEEYETENKKMDRCGMLSGGKRNFKSFGSIFAFRENKSRFHSFNRKKFI